MCDILYIIIAASAEPFHGRSLGDYSRKVSSLANDCRDNIANNICDKLDYITSLTDDASDARGEATSGQQPASSRTSDILQKRDIIALLNDKTMAGVLDSTKTVRQGSYYTTDRIYASNCPEGHVLNEIQKESFLVEYQHRAGIRLRPNENSTRITFRTPDEYPCPVCSENSRVDHSQGLGSLTSLTEITEFTELSRILEDAKVEVSHAVRDLSRYYQRADAPVEVNFSRNRSSVQIQTSHQNNTQQNGRSGAGSTAGSGGQSSQSSSSSGRGSARGSRSSNTPLPSPTGSSGSNNGIRKLKSSFGLMKLMASPKDPEIDLSHLNTGPILISTHTSSARVFFCGNSSISIYSYAGTLPEPRSKIEVDSISASATIAVSPSNNFLAVAINLVRGNSQIQVWSLDNDGYNPTLAWQQVLEGPVNGLAVHPDERFVFVITNKWTLNIFELSDGSRAGGHDIPSEMGTPSEISIVGQDILLFRCSPDVQHGQARIFTLKFGTSGCQMGWDYYIQWRGREQDDNGVSALSLCETRTSGSTLCYSTWTMSGQPSIIRWGPGRPTSNYQLQDHSLGTRIQDMAIVPTADFVALINERGDIYQYATSYGSHPRLLKTISLGNRRRSTHSFKERVCLNIDEDHNKIIVAYTRNGQGFIEKHDMAFSGI
ncbi:hypothetical protein TWF481_010800 [Arthrobotrys musiformis]|uniref:DUF7099 domain-containing protein n=1 Tax=Arthrobotrys musiformis TaxID=47236 RepID=A0AAV9W7Q8_9PEZI